MNQEQAISELQEQVKLLTNLLNNREEKSASSDNTTSTEAKPQLRIREPDPFHGNIDEDVDQWLYSLRTYFGICGVTDWRVQLHFAINLLRDNSSVWWQRKYREDPNWNFATFNTAIRNQYKPVNYEDEARNKLFTLRQATSVHVYAHEFMKASLEVSGISEENLIFLFINGLRYHIRNDVRTRAPKTLTSAISFATNFDIVKFGAPNQTLHRPTNPSHPTEYVPMEVDALQRSQIDRDKLRREGRCFRCQEKGHIGVNCPTYPGPYPRNPNNRSENSRRQ
jgi:hypothetical protein